MAATRALRFSDHVTKRNGGSGDEYETRTAERLGESSRAHARLSKFTSGSRRSSSRAGILRCLLFYWGRKGELYTSYHIRMIS